MVTRSSTRGLVALITPLMLLLCSSGICLADEDATADSLSRNSLTAGSKALLFQIDDNFQLSSFDGATISLKKQRSAKSAIRLGLSISGSLSDRDLDVDHQPPSDYVDVTDRDGSRISVSLSALFLSYPTSHKTTNLYFGFGPAVSISKNRSENSSERYSPSYKRESTRTSRSLSISGVVAGAIGVEWFMSKTLSLTAEYGLLLRYIYRDTDSTEKNIITYYEGDTDWSSVKHSTIDREFGLSSLPVKLGLSVYF